MENGVYILIIAALAAMAIYGLRWYQVPKAGTERLAITVWAAFGPYHSAEEAEEYLRHACRVVFGDERVAEHEEWIKGHTGNFHNWQTSDEFEKSHQFMIAGLRATSQGPAFDAAYSQVKKEIIANGLQAMERINKSLIEPGGHKLEAEKQSDGSMQFAYKKIWSDEEIERNNRGSSEAILEAVGSTILNDKSIQAQLLLAYLREAYRANADKDLETTKEIGKVWFACLALEKQDPNSDLAKTFTALNDAWSATRPNSNQEKPTS